jgi:5'-3' exonuclease
MGVPAFFRWLTMRFPKILLDAVELDQFEMDDNEIDLGISSGPQETLDIENLYLDMNGIIHPCCHPTSGVSIYSNFLQSHNHPLKLRCLTTLLNTSTS